MSAETVNNGVLAFATPEAAGRPLRQCSVSISSPSYAAVSPRAFASLVAVTGALVATLAAGRASAAPATSAPPSPAPPAATSAITPVQDPWQGLNRRLFSFSQGVDSAVVAPVVHGYMRITPRPVRNGISNALDNLDEPRVAVNDILQGHPVQAGHTTARFAINSTAGVLGLFDVAGRGGILHHDSDFGQTLGRYGLIPGPYLFVPLAGPTNFRDGLGRIVDTFLDPVGLLAGGITTTFGASRTALGAVDTRLGVDDQMRALKQDAADPYATLRSAYSQQRAFLVQQSTGQAADLPDLADIPPAPDEQHATAPAKPTAPGSTSEER
ncbi:MAG: VacJ family lipoprotein [Caulobacteraceae bacterium]|nr:VacJ family lipoprotein [Caulobacteraceae bacterium]